MMIKLQGEVVLGPEERPRFGRSVTVRPTVETARAGRYPTQAVVVTAAARILIDLSKGGDKVKSVIVEAGAADPTLHPEFHEISLNLRELCNKWFPKADLVLLSDTPDLSRAQQRHALSFYDKPILRLEAGTQKTHTALTGEKAGSFKERVANMNRLEIERLVVQAQFVRGDVDNSKDTEVKAWLKYIGEIKPAAIEISTLAKAQSKTKPITKTRITQIAELITEKTGIPVEVTS